MVKFTSLLKDADIFGKKVNLTHQGSETYNTTKGGCLSILFLLSLFGFGVSKLVEVWTYKIQSISTHEDFNTLDDPDYHIDLMSKEFNFAIGFKDHLPMEIGHL